jgi:hypothetical protein
MWRVAFDRGAGLFFASSGRCRASAGGVLKSEEPRIIGARELDARRQCMNLEALMERGLLSQSECSELQKIYSDPSFSYITMTAFVAWGKRSGLA